MSSHTPGGPRPGTTTAGGSPSDEVHRRIEDGTVNDVGSATPTRILVDASTSAGSSSNRLRGRS
jgi:hypothetical protein